MPATPTEPERRTRRSGSRSGAGRGDTGDGAATRRGRSSKRREPKPPPPDLADQPEADQEAVARKILLDQLTGQARSRKELAEKLAKRGVPEELAARLLDRFEEVGLIDDAAFARLWVGSRQPGKGLARRALQQELRRKGVADEVAKEALDEIDPADEEAAARRLVQRKLRSMRGLDPQVATRRLAGMLARKGYPPGMCFSVVRSELDAAELDATDLEVPDDL
ncbi:regulatory protein RecX [Nocardioides sp. Bht2]|uniref:regulatory protein RecX n=1 Tax=Nocardioides sp. Bht2 TaxID=3392297 RepID=UPI0039B4B3FD